MNFNTKNPIIDSDQNTLKVQLNLDKVMIVDNTPHILNLLSKYKFYARENHGNWYVMTNIPTNEPIPTGLRSRGGVYLHLMLCPSVKGMNVDHINKNSLDNRMYNLRVVTQNVNKANQTRLYKNNTTGTTGIYRYEKRGYWQSYCRIDGKNKSKSFNDKKYGGKIGAFDAAKAYQIQMRSKISVYIEAGMIVPMSSSSSMEK